MSTDWRPMFAEICCFLSFGGKKLPLTYIVYVLSSVMNGEKLEL